MHHSVYQISLLSDTWDRIYSLFPGIKWTTLVSWCVIVRSHVSWLCQQFEVYTLDAKYVIEFWWNLARMSWQYLGQVWIWVISDQKLRNQVKSEKILVHSRGHIIMWPNYKESWSECSSSQSLGQIQISIKWAQKLGHQVKWKKILYTLAVTYLTQFWLHSATMFTLTISRPRSNLGHVKLKTRSPGQILENPCLQSRGYICYPISELSLKLASNWFMSVRSLAKIL